jgi:hypothetical protein
MMFKENHIVTGLRWGLMISLPIWCVVALTINALVS